MPRFLNSRDGSGYEVEVIRFQILYLEVSRPLFSRLPMFRTKDTGIKVQAAEKLELSKSPAFGPRVD